MSEYKVDLLPFTEIKGVGDRTKNYKLCDFYVASSYNLICHAQIIMIMLASNL